MRPFSEASARCAAQLARNLLARGLLDDPWAEAFTQVPRDLFLSSCYHHTGDSWALYTPDRVGEQRWLQLAYHDVTWVQRLNGPGIAAGVPASSCVQPSLAAQMLVELAVGPGDRVLEVGTGTGWLTALLSHRCGAENVTGVELDPTLIQQARTTLNALGYKPTLICADGFNADEGHAPYHGILSTAAVTHLPKPWLTQTRPGGRIVAPLRGAIAVMHTQDPDHATGHFLPEPVQILPLRSPQDHAFDDPATGASPSSESTSAITALRDQRFRFVLGLKHPSLTVDDHGPLGALLVSDPHGSSIRISSSGEIHVNGRRNIWAAVSDAHTQWEHAGRPGTVDFLIEVDGESQWTWPATSPPAQRWRLR